MKNKQPIKRSDDKTDYLAEVVYDQTFAERLSHFKIMPDKAMLPYSDYVAIMTARAYITRLEEENELLKARLVRMEQ